ncbi:MAG: glycosyltransferase family 2 protein [Nitrospinota bacterium]|nr:glycosyltransferase family 2 protein [Nitrospinota bacterium]
MPTTFTPQISIIILNWNGWQDTIECLASIANITYPNYRVIIVDNHSNDGSEQKIHQSFPDIHIIQNETNLGFSEGNNVGIREALRSQAEYILILNNDTVLDPSIFSHLLKEAMSNDGLAIYSPRIHSYSSPNEVCFGGAQWLPEKARFRLLTSANTDFPYSATASYKTEFAMGCAMFFNRRIPEEIGLLDSIFFLNWEEVDWCTRAQKAGIPTFHVPTAKVLHKISSTIQNKTKLGTAQYYLTRNWLLWIERHLQGREKIFAYRCHLKEIYRQAKKIFKSNTDRTTHVAILKARLEGLLHYCFRIFGQRPSDRH